MPRSVQERTLEIAVRVAGSVPELARYLGVPAAHIQSMLEGKEEIATWIFLRCVDCINDLQRDSRPTVDAERHDGSETRQ